MKTCKICGITKNNSLFLKDRNKCRSCHSKYCKDRRKNNDELRKKENEDMTWRRRNREYGLSKEQFYIILKKQKEKCAICSIFINDRCSVDHNHITGKARGLLCNNCNSGIGMFEDNVFLLNQAIKYLNL